MAGYRKLGRTSSQRKALLRGQVTSLIASKNGRIITTEVRAKEVQKIVEGIIAMAVKEKDNYEMVKVTAKVPKKDKDGKRIKERRKSRRIFLQGFMQEDRYSGYYILIPRFPRRGQAEREIRKRLTL